MCLTQGHWGTMFGLEVGQHFKEKQQCGQSALTGPFIVTVGEFNDQNTSCCCVVFSQKVSQGV